MALPPQNSKAEVKFGVEFVVEFRIPSCSPKKIQSFSETMSTFDCLDYAGRY